MSVGSVNIKFVFIFMLIVGIMIIVILVFSVVKEEIFRVKGLVIGLFNIVWVLMLVSFNVVFIVNVINVFGSCILIRIIWWCNDKLLGVMMFLNILVKFNCVGLALIFNNKLYMIVSNNFDIIVVCRN